MSKNPGRFKRCSHYIGVWDIQGTNKLFILLWEIWWRNIYWELVLERELVKEAMLICKDILYVLKQVMILCQQCKVCNANINLENLLLTWYMHSYVDFLFLKLLVILLINNSCKTFLKLEKFGICVNLKNYNQLVNLIQSVVRLIQLWKLWNTNLMEKARKQRTWWKLFNKVMELFRKWRFIRHSSNQVRWILSKEMIQMS